MADVREAEVHTPKTSLFRAPFYKDWTVVLGLVAVGAVAVSTAQEYPPFWSANSFDRTAALIDHAVGLCFQIGVFCFLPAAVRDRKSKWWAAQSHQPLRARWVWLLAVVAAVGSTVAVGFADASASPSGLPPRECRPRGADIVCVEWIYADETSATFQSEWIYAETRPLEGFNVASFRWFTEFDCATRNARIYDLRGLGQSGQLLPLSATVVSQMQSGLQGNADLSLMPSC